MVTSEFNTGGVDILLLDSSVRLWPDGPLGSYANFTYAGCLS